MIAELKCYASPVGTATPPSDQCAVEACISYLQAMQNMFQLGALSELPIGSPSAPPMRNMEKSMKYVKQWYFEVHKKGAFSKRIDQCRAFWSMDTFDNFRYLYYGIRKLVQTFLNRFPGYYLVLHRLTGSAVESLFSGLRHYSSGDLTSVNYGPLLGRIRNIQDTRLISRKRRRDEYLNTTLAIKKPRNC